MSNAHDHFEVRLDYDWRFGIGVGLNAAFVLAETILGVVSNSLSLIADAGHNLSDVLALLLAWGAVALSRRLPTARRTFGWGRSTILAALGNALSLVAVTGAVGWEAARRLAEPAPVDSGMMVAAAAAGVVINTSTALLFLADRRRDMNIQGAFLHMAADAAVSLGVIVTGMLIGFTGWYWLDAAAGLGIALVILVSTWGLLRGSFNLALDAVPEGVDMGRIRRYLEALPDVTQVHDLHVWGMSTTATALSAHLVIPDREIDDSVLAGVADELHELFGIEHTTLQVEHGDPLHPCPLAAHAGW